MSHHLIDYIKRHSTEELYKSDKFYFASDSIEVKAANESSAIKCGNMKDLVFANKGEDVINNLEDPYVLVVVSDTSNSHHLNFFHEFDCSKGRKIIATKDIGPAGCFYVVSLNPGLFDCYVSGTPTLRFPTIEQMITCRDASEMNILHQKLVSEFASPDTRAVPYTLLPPALVGPFLMLNQVTALTDETHRYHHKNWFNTFVGILQKFCSEQHFDSLEPFEQVLQFAWLCIVRDEWGRGEGSMCYMNIMNTELREAKKASSKVIQYHNRKGLEYREHLNQVALGHTQLLAQHREEIRRRREEEEENRDLLHPYAFDEL